VGVTALGAFTIPVSLFVHGIVRLAGCAQGAATRYVAHDTGAPLTAADLP